MWPGDYQRPATLNVWNYVDANPTDKVDPRGTYSIRVIMESLRGKTLQEVFGRTQEGFARWGLYHLLKDAKDRDIISPLTYAAEMEREENWGVWAIAQRNRTPQALRTFDRQLHLSGTGSYVVSSNGCDLVFTSHAGGSEHPLPLPAFVDEIEEYAAHQGGLEFWRKSTWANHWYALNDKYYSDFGSKTDLPDFRISTADIPMILIPIGPTFFKIVDRYGNYYVGEGITGGIGKTGLHFVEGYVDTPVTPDEPTLRNILKGWTTSLTATAFGEVGGTMPLPLSPGPITIQVGYGAWAGISGSLTHTWYWKKNEQDAWNWIEMIRGYSAP